MGWGHEAGVRARDRALRGDSIIGGWRIADGDNGIKITPQQFGWILGKNVAWVPGDGDGDGYGYGYVSGDGSGSDSVYGCGDGAIGGLGIVAVIRQNNQQRAF